MKYTRFFSCVVTILVLSFPVVASEITETYNTGETLTSDKMESIKSAVNDNDSRIIILENDFTLSDLMCSSGQVAKFDGTSWVCGSDIANGSDTLTNLSCGSGQVAKFDGAQWVCAEDNDTDEESLGDLPCNSGQVAKFDGTQWICAEDFDTDEESLGDLPCSSGEVAKFDGVQWNCANDDAATSGEIEQAAAEVLEKRVYGDGSAGDEVISTLINWTNPGPSQLVTNFQFSSFHVQAGGELTVNSGTVIRSSGDVTIDGALFVDTFAEGGYNAFQSSSRISMAAPGLARSAAGLPRYVQVNGGEPNPLPTSTSHSLIIGGAGGFGIDDLALVAGTTLRSLGPNGGGGGTGWEQPGGAGGGTLTIIAKGTITVTGSIEANGDDAPFATGGGGGAGIGLLASQTAIDLTSGLVRVAGGDGGDSSDMAAAGGGGGGGIVHLIAPTVGGESSVLAPEGQRGASQGALMDTTTVFAGGGAGGGSGGRGGDGGFVQLNSTSIVDGFDGGPGRVYVTEIDPTNQLF